jgi:putative copper export protein
MLTANVDTLRLFLHVLAASVWVGGQIVLAVAVPALRRVSADAAGAAAAAFNRVAWPAFAVLLATGIWNVVAEGDQGDAYQHTLAIKLSTVALSGLAAVAHIRATSPPAKAALGALSGLTAIGALMLGILLAE